MLPGMMGFLVGAIAGGANGTVSFSGATISDTGGAFASASVEFRTDGSYWKNEGGVETQLGNWIDPQLGMLRHQIRFTNATGAAPSATAAEDVWHSFGDGDYTAGLSVGINASASGTFDIEVRLGENAVLDSGAFMVSVSTL